MRSFRASSRGVSVVSPDAAPDVGGDLRGVSRRVSLRSEGPYCCRRLEMAFGCPCWLTSWRLLRPVRAVIQDESEQEEAVMGLQEFDDEGGAPDEDEDEDDDDEDDSDDDELSGLPEVRNTGST